MKKLLVSLLFCATAAFSATTNVYVTDLAEALPATNAHWLVLYSTNQTMKVSLSNLVNYITRFQNFPPPTNLSGVIVGDIIFDPVLGAGRFMDTSTNDPFTGFMDASADNKFEMDTNDTPRAVVRRFELTNVLDELVTPRMEARVGPLTNDPSLWWPDTESGGLSGWWLTRSNGTVRFLYVDTETQTSSVFFVEQRNMILPNYQPATAGLSNYNPDAFVPAAMSNAFRTDLNGAQPTNPILSALSGGMGYDQTIVTHPITGEFVPAGGDWLYFCESFKTYSAAAWPASRPIVISGLSTYIYKPINAPELTEYIGGLWLWVTNWPGRITYAYYGPGNTFSGSGPMRLRTNSWFDVQLRQFYGGHNDASTNLEVYAGWTDAPGLAAGTMPREGAIFLRRPAGTGPANDWAAVVYKANAVVASNRLGWSSGSNEWPRLTITGSSNSLVFLTNGVPAITNTVTFMTNRLFPTIYLRSVVTNTGSAFHSNSIWIDRWSVKE